MQRLAVFKVDGRRNVCYDTEKQLSNRLIEGTEKEDLK